MSFHAPTVPQHAPAGQEIKPAPVVPSTTVTMDTRGGTDWYEQSLPLADALKKIRTLGKKRTVFLHVNHQAPDATNPDLYWPVAGTVKVSRAVAGAFVADAYQHFDARGARVKLVWCDTCLFVG